MFLIEWQGTNSNPASVREGPVVLNCIDRLTPERSPVSTFSLPANAARRLLVTYPQCYKYPEQRMLPAAFP